MSRVTARNFIDQITYFYCRMLFLHALGLNILIKLKVNFTI